MNKEIKSLTAQLESEQITTQAKVDSIREKLQLEWNKVFNDSNKLKQAIDNAERASMYQFNECGDIESWFRYSDLSNYSDCQEYFETWLADNYGMNVDWENECFLISH